jgi:hypothetical protein
MRQHCGQIDHPRRRLNGGRLDGRDLILAQGLARWGSAFWATGHTGQSEAIHSVAALASALAKAQAELANPEKSLIATIRSGRPGGSAAFVMPRSPVVSTSCV